MIYAAQIAKTDNAITVGAYDNNPLVPILAFANKAEFDALQAKLWANGDRFEGSNLVRISRAQVVGYYSNNFTTWRGEDGIIEVGGPNFSDSMNDIATYERMHPEIELS